MKQVRLATMKTGWAAVLLALAGCDPLTREHYDLIQIRSSTKLDVEETLGKPTTQHDDEWYYNRERKRLSVFIYFSDEGVVTRKQWLDTAVQDWNSAPLRGGTIEKPSEVRPIE